MAIVSHEMLHGVKGKYPLSALNQINAGHVSSIRIQIQQVHQAASFLEKLGPIQALFQLDIHMAPPWGHKKILSARYALSHTLQLLFFPSVHR